MNPVGHGSTPEVFQQGKGQQKHVAESMNGTDHEIKMSGYLIADTVSEQLTEPTVRHSQLDPTVGHTLLIPASIHAVDALVVVDTAAQISMISQSFLDSLKPTLKVSREHIRIRNAKHGSNMRCRIIWQLPITIQGKQFKIGVAVGPVTDDFIIGLDFLLKHHCIVNVESSIVTVDGDTVYAVMKKGVSGCNNVSRVHVTQRTVVPLNHRVNVIERPVVIEIMNDTNRQVVLKQGELLTQAIELDEMMTTDTEVQQPSVNVRHYGVDDDRGLSSWEEGNKIHDEMSPPRVASFIPDDSMEDEYISAKLNEVELRIPKHLTDMFERAKENISKREQIALGLLICQYANVVSTGSKDLGKFSLIYHRIKTFNEEPVRERLRRTPLKFQGEE